jgi:hypothetical protein
MTDLATIADAVDALTNPNQVRELIYEGVGQRRRLVREWRTTAPPLITQLAASTQPGIAYIEDTGGHGHTTPRSIPPARLDAINAILRIEAGTALWCHRGRLHLRDNLAANLRGLVGLPWNSDQAIELLQDLRRWYGLAATLTGWERPPWRPDAPCPMCDIRGGLRVRLDRRTAVCVDCGATWNEATISLLAEYVRRLTDAAATRHVQPA